MKFLLYYISLITIFTIPKTYSGSSKVPGSSGCTYFATIKEWCKKENVPVSDLPKECTSLIYFDIRADSSLKVAFGYPDVANDEYLNNMLGSNKDVFIYYGHSDVQEWVDVLSCNKEDDGVNAKTEISNLKTFLAPYDKISGLILQGLTIEPTTNNTCGYSDNFKIYLDEIKKAFPNYGIGVEIMGARLSDLYESTPPVWLDFKALDALIDFYVINVYYFNQCTDEFKDGGTAPINGNALYTIEKVAVYLKQMCIPKNKIYFAYSSGPKSTDKDASSCDLTNEKICTNPNLCGICSDNTKTYYEKGKYTSGNGAGFIAMDVDLVDDPYGCCQCGSGYPAFHAMLAGFNDCSVPPVCHLLDKN